jgi:hypothetical protein
MNETQIRILNILNQGRNNAKTADEIVTELDLPYDRTNIAIRNEIKSLRRDFNQLIGSNNEGFFMIVDDEDFSVTIRHLESRVRETNTIIERLQSNFQNRQNG